MNMYRHLSADAGVLSAAPRLVMEASTYPEALHICFTCNQHAVMLIFARIASSDDIIVFPKVRK